MAAADENYVLVCLTSDKAISGVIRSYLSERRAKEDLELLREMDPAVTYEVIPVEYIDN